MISCEGVRQTPLRIIFDCGTQVKLKGDVEFFDILLIFDVQTSTAKNLKPIVVKEK
jgi:hypothetical protein